MHSRLRSHLDYYVAILLWSLFFFSVFSIWAIGALVPPHGGLVRVIQVSPLLGFFPLFATFGMISDRILIKDILNHSNYANSPKNHIEQKEKLLVSEDYLRIIFVAIITFVGLPYIAALFGIPNVLFFQPIHLGLNHGYLGVYMLLSVILISKTEKLYTNSIFKEISIYLLCFLTLWGLGLLIEDFAKEQLFLNFPFVVLGNDFEFLLNLIIQIVIVGIISFLSYYLGWRKYYRRKLM